MLLYCRKKVKNHPRTKAYEFTPKGTFSLLNWNMTSKLKIKKKKLSIYTEKGLFIGIAINQVTEKIKELTNNLLQL